MTEILELGDLKFHVRRSARRTTLGLTVDRAGELVIHSPSDVDPEALKRWARSKQLWVHRKMAMKAELAARAREPEFVTGESFCYLGRSYRLTIVRTQDERLRFDGSRFTLRRDSRDAAENLFREWYVQTGKKWILARVAALAPKLGVHPAKVEVRDLGFRWGSCGRTGTLRFNWKLLQLPPRLVDYVIAHEMGHLMEPNHGPAFWQVLDRSMPDWSSRQEELRLRAADTYWCHAAMAQ